MAWIISSSILGVALGYGETAQADVRTCLSAASIAGIDFSDDCKAMSFGNPPHNVELFKLSMAREVPVIIAQYNTDFAVAHAPQMVNGLIAVRYDPRQAQLASSAVSVQCPTTFSAAHQLGCDTLFELSTPRLASR